MNENNGLDIKRNALLIVISVIVLTLATISVSYSAFFSVQSQSTVQQIKAGVLDVVIDSSSYVSEELFPTATSLLPVAANSTEDTSMLHGSVTLRNDGTIPAEYSITLSANTPNGETPVDFQYVNVGIVDDSASSWHDFGTNVFYTPLTTLGSSDTFPILRDTIATNTSKQYRIYVWLSEETPATEIGKYVYLKIDIKSMTINGRIDES